MHLRDIVESMRWGALLLTAVLAACGGGTGVDIDIIVPGDAKITRVELWVAYDECFDCPEGVGWTAGERARGSIYFLRDEQIVKAVQQGERWVLHLDADSDFADPPWLAIVGFDGDKITAAKVLRDVRIPVSTVVTWQVYLHPAQQATTDLVTPPVDPAFDHRAHVWARSPTPELREPTGCLAYQAWDGASWETEYFVPKTDPDCDGIPLEVECSEYWFEYRPGVSACVLDAGAALPNTCVLGSSLCADGLSTDRTCRLTLETMTCLSDAICDHCSDNIPADDCVREAVESAIAVDTTAHYHCDFDTSSNGEACPGQTLNLQLPFSVAQCGTPKLHYIDRPFTDPMDALTFGVAPTTAKFGIKPNATGPCLVNIEWLGGTMEAFKDGVVFLIDMPYDNATRALYPVQLRATNTTIQCPALPGKCDPGGPMGDGVVHCAAAP
jgi:hypothetical protein